MRLLVIGNGSIGRRHAANLETLGAQVTHLPYRAFHQGAAHDGQFDAVVIATATQIRTEPIAFATERGLPFYVEKPLAFRQEDLARITDLARPVAERSMTGYMMRYHPAFRHLAGMDLSDIYRARFEIGHDVRQWRSNWSFAESYAARPEGGGALLDLCHEIDMAAALFPDLKIGAVTSHGHPAFPGVDFATEIGFSPTGTGPAGAVGMDYLSPVSLRRISLRGTRHTVDFDLAAGSYRIATGGTWQGIDFAFDRNEMFLAAMRDFLALVAGKPVSDVEHLPRFDLALPSSALVVEAYEARRFAGMIDGEFA
ncbi:MAG: hypothetical protein R3E44_08250 [Paracoccaceae bacterium]